jgi:hypothetical protein
MIITLTNQLTEVKACACGIVPDGEAAVLVPDRSAAVDQHGSGPCSSATDTYPRGNYSVRGLPAGGYCRATFSDPLLMTDAESRTAGAARQRVWLADGRPSRSI